MAEAGHGKQDVVDDVLAAWRRERPDLDLRAVGLVGRLGRLALMIAPAQQLVLEQFGLLSGEFDVLAALRRAGEPFVLTPSALSAQLMLSRAGMTHRLDRLESVGLIERTLDPDDRRSFRIRLTDAGHATGDAAMTAHTANLTRLLAGMDEDDRSTLDQLLRRLLQHLQDP